MPKLINADKLARKFGNLSARSLLHMEKAVHNALKNVVQPAAKLAAPANQGELRQRTKTRVELKATSVLGTLYNDAPHAPYVEFGTGPKGAADHAGISPEVSVSYRSTPWYVHESQIDPGPYHFIKHGEFYKMYGQAAQPFMYPALKNNEDRVTKNIGNYVARKIREEASK